MLFGPRTGPPFAFYFFNPLDIDSDTPQIYATALFLQSKFYAARLGGRFRVGRAWPPVKYTFEGYFPNIQRPRAHALRSAKPPNADPSIIDVGGFKLP